IIGFNVSPHPVVRKIADNENVEIRLYRVIYEAIEDIKKAIKGMLAPQFKEKILGHAEVRQLFKVSKVGTIAGCHVVDGKVTRQASVRIIRDGVVIYEGNLASLKRFKDDVREVAAGFDCGLMIDKFNDLSEKDIIEAYTLEKIQPE
ncbi:MAG TPA: translation initiation factor IF-2, partial [Firmicutes bacterium]|nr:translation initiation factor IF-2 [Bacillota bacterium]